MLQSGEKGSRQRAIEIDGVGHFESTRTFWFRHFYSVLQNVMKKYFEINTSVDNNYWLLLRTAHGYQLNYSLKRGNATMACTECNKQRNAEGEQNGGRWV